MTITYTTNRSYPKPDFDSSAWHVQIDTALDMIDVDMGARTAFDPFITAEQWVVSTSYAVNNVIIDGTDATLWRCNTLHTSPASGTFAAYRTANPTVWTNVGVTLRIRGAWAQGTIYMPLDHVYSTTDGISAICTVQHTSTASGTIRTDVAKWAFIVDLTNIITDVQKGQAILEGQIYGG